MELCSNNHEEVCYEGRVCPVCDMRNDMQDRIDELAKEIKGLENELSSIE